VAGKIARIWEALDACFKANPQPMTKSQVVAWINEAYKGNEFHSGTLYHQLRRSCANRPSAAQYNAPKILLYDEQAKTYRRVDMTTGSSLGMFPDAEDTAVACPSNADDSDELGDSTFALEGHLRDFLAKNLGYLEKGLELWSVSPPSVEYPIGGRRIDILARDQHGLPVVIELKLNKGYDRVIGQALLYRGLITQSLDATQVRIMLVANSVSEELRIACSSLSDVTLFEYSISMQIEKVNPSQAEE
jgi:endonuclease